VLFCCWRPPPKCHPPRSASSLSLDYQSTLSHQLPNSTIHISNRSATQFSLNDGFHCSSIRLNSPHSAAVTFFVGIQPVSIPHSVEVNSTSAGCQIPHSTFFLTCIIFTTLHSSLSFAVIRFFHLSHFPDHWPSALLQGRRSFRSDDVYALVCGELKSDVDAREVLRSNAAWSFPSLCSCLTDIGTVSELESVQV
jgi:hypothetical protein